MPARPRKSRESNDYTPTRRWRESNSRFTAHIMKKPSYNQHVFSRAGHLELAIESILRADCQPSGLDVPGWNPPVRKRWTKIETADSWTAASSPWSKYRERTSSSGNSRPVRVVLCSVRELNSKTLPIWRARVRKLNNATSIRENYERFEANRFFVHRNLRDDNADK